MHRLSGTSTSAVPIADPTYARQLTMNTIVTVIFIFDVVVLPRLIVVQSWSCGTDCKDWGVVLESIAVEKRYEQKRKTLNLQRVCIRERMTELFLCDDD